MLCLSAFVLLWAHSCAAFQHSARSPRRCLGGPRAATDDDGVFSGSRVPPEGAAYWEGMRESASLKGPAVLSFDFLLAEGWAAHVDLWAEADAGPAAASILVDYPDASASLEDLTLALQTHWARAVRTARAGHLSPRYQPLVVVGRTPKRFDYEALLPLLPADPPITLRCPQCLLGRRRTCRPTARPQRGQPAWWPGSLSATPAWCSRLNAARNEYALG
jgi:hypothetical protein